jgi:hypothetical protein
MPNAVMSRSLLLFSALPWTCVVVDALNHPKNCGGLFFSPKCPPGLLDVPTGYIFSIMILLVSIVHLILLGNSASPSRTRRDLTLLAVRFNVLYLVLAIPTYIILRIVSLPGLLNLGLL